MAQAPKDKTTETIKVKTSRDCYINKRDYVAGDEFHISKDTKLPDYLKEVKEVKEVKED